MSEMQCSECKRSFSLKSNLTRHLRMVHNVEIEREDILPGSFDTYQYKCMDGCKISFKYNRELRKHLNTKHNIEIVELNLEFPNSEEFTKWLEDEESTNLVKYVHLTATKRKSTGGETFYFECNRTGKSSQIEENSRKRKARKCITKLNRGCTSQIIVNKSYDNIHSVVYYKTHYGHNLDLNHVNLSKRERGGIASKLLLGIPISTVLESTKASKNQRLSLIGKKDVTNIRRAYNIDIKDGKISNDFNLFLTECTKLAHNPILYSNFDHEDISIAIMSRFQERFLRELTSAIYVVNHTILQNCGFDLITLFLVNDNETYPSACLFVNTGNPHVYYERFLRAIKARVGILKPRVFLTGCDVALHDAWLKVMDPETHCIYNPCQIEADLKLNLNRITCEELEVTKIKRKWVYDTVKMLESNVDEVDFLDTLEATRKVLAKDPDFKDFLGYFTRNFTDAKKWALCYRIGVVIPQEQIQVLGDVIRQYLFEQTRLDRVFHSVIRFVRDETANALLKTSTNRGFLVREIEKRHELIYETSLIGSFQQEFWQVAEGDDGPSRIVHKYLEEKCCNLTCSDCDICIHCFSCSCVDFFTSCAICIHIHYVFVTFFQPETTEDIVIQINEEVPDRLEELKQSITAASETLCANITGIKNEETLSVILGTLQQLCEIPQEKEPPDHSYL